MADTCCSLPNTTDWMVGFDVYTAVVEPGQTGKTVTNQASKDGTEIGGTKNQ